MGLLNRPSGSGSGSGGGGSVPACRAGAGAVTATTATAASDDENNKNNDPSCASGSNSGDEGDGGGDGGGGSVVRRVSVVINHRVSGAYEVTAKQLEQLQERSSLETTIAVEEDAECPLCCCVMSAADQLYPMHCPTGTCDFNYCESCLRGMRAAAADGYQKASDGSNQVKVSVQCPACRAKYGCARYPSDVVVEAVLQLRRAAGLQDCVAGCLSDSELSATVLGHKRMFLESCSTEELQDAVNRVWVYQETIRKASHAVPQLDWIAWSRAFEQYGDQAKLVEAARRRCRRREGAAETSSFSSQPRTTGSNDDGETAGDYYVPATTEFADIVDVTLLQGLEHFMSKAEQQFVTELFLSRTVDSLLQGALILHGILEMAASPAAAAAAIRQLSTFENGGASASSANASSAAEEDPLESIKLRKRFPLPLHMPRCVRWPVYDPVSDAAADGSGKNGKAAAKQQTALKLEGTHGKKKKQNNDKDNSSGPNPLSIFQIRGLAGQLGLRKGDAVTHCNGEACNTLDDWIAAVSRAWSQRDATEPTSMHVVVNCNATTAKALVDRAVEMRRAGVFRRKK